MPSRVVRPSISTMLNSGDIQYSSQWHGREEDRSPLCFNSSQRMQLDSERRNYASFRHGLIQMAYPETGTGTFDVGIIVLLQYGIPRFFPLTRCIYEGSHNSEPLEIRSVHLHWLIYQNGPQSLCDLYVGLIFREGWGLNLSTG
jgi:hypothetical protein